MEVYRQKSREIGKFILNRVSSHPGDIVKIVAQKFAISRQAAARHLKKLIHQGIIETEGNTSGRIYRLSKGRVVDFTFPITGREDGPTVWKTTILPLLQANPDNVIDLWNSCFTEIFNNSCLHSAGKTLRVQVVQYKNQTTLKIFDNGRGVFRSIKERLHLSDDIDAAVRLAKGQLPAAPSAGRGNSILFTSRLTDHLTVLSGKITLTHQNDIAWDWAIDTSSEEIEGTIVSMRIENKTQRIRDEILAQTTAPKAGSIPTPRICIPVRLVQYSAEALFSRSQARRILARIQRFDIAVLNFTDVDTIGPAFADQIFRVFTSEHPDVQVLHSNANRQIEAAIQSAKDNSAMMATSAKS